jgi:hypothetical protein
MARKIFVVAMLLTACAVGVVGYQIGSHWIEGTWPSVPVRVVWEGLFELESRGGRGGSLGGLPASGTLLVLAYVLYFISDQLRLR